MELTNDELLRIEGGKVKLVTIIEVIYTVYGIVKTIVKRVKR